MSSTSEVCHYFKLIWWYLFVWCDYLSCFSLTLVDVKTISYFFRQIVRSPGRLVESKDTLLMIEEHPAKTDDKGNSNLFKSFFNRSSPYSLLNILTKVSQMSFFRLEKKQPHPNLVSVQPDVSTRKVKLNFAWLQSQIGRFKDGHFPFLYGEFRRLSVTS